MKRYAPLQAAKTNALESASQRKLKPISGQNADPLQRLADQSGQVSLLQRLHAGADSHVQRMGIPAQRAATEDEDVLQGKFKTAQLAALEEEEPLQGRFETAQAAGFEEEEPLQGKFERVTGSREAVHCKVDPTTEVNGVPVNDDPALEHEADVMGAKAAQFVPEEEDPLQGKFGAVAQKAEAQPNQTGLPDNLKAGVENLSGMRLDSVRVHYNSSKPAQLHALAYAQGTDIHVGPGQEKHLPHEAWHVVQQNSLGTVSQLVNGSRVKKNKKKELLRAQQGGVARSQNFSQNWQVITIDQYLQENPFIGKRSKPKLGSTANKIEISTSGGFVIVIDKAGGYYRVSNGAGVYLDSDGNASNDMAATHFRGK